MNNSESDFDEKKEHAEFIYQAIGAREVYRSVLDILTKDNLVVAGHTFCGNYASHFSFDAVVTGAVNDDVNVFSLTDKILTSLHDEGFDAHIYHTASYAHPGISFLNKVYSLEAALKHITSSQESDSNEEKNTATIADIGFLTISGTEKLNLKSQNRRYATKSLMKLDSCNYNITLVTSDTLDSLKMNDFWYNYTKYALERKNYDVYEPLSEFIAALEMK